MINFKESKDKKMFTLLHPILIIIVADADWFMMKRGYQGVTITDSVSTKSRDESIGRTSSSHREFRAVDLRVRDYHEDDIKLLKEYLEKKYNKYAAYSARTGKPSLFVYGDEHHLDHIHLQIHKKFAIIN